MVLNREPCLILTRQGLALGAENPAQRTQRSLALSKCSVCLSKKTPNHQHHHLSALCVTDKEVGCTVMHSSSFPAVKYCRAWEKGEG